MLKFLLFCLAFFVSVNVIATSYIYIIRHAAVNIERPKWANTQTIHNYKLQYNTNTVQEFDIKTVLAKIDSPETIDTVFCSPQSRALQTAIMLFGTQAKLRINENLMELDYHVIQVPFIKLPTKMWQTASFIFWLAGINKSTLPSYKYRKQNIDIYSNQIIAYAQRHGKAVVVAHGIHNQLLIKMLKKKGWEFKLNDGHANVSVNCMVKSKVSI